MAAGTLSDFVVNPEQFFGGMVETAQQNVAAFNGDSNGTILLAPGQHPGEEIQKSFVTYGGSLVARRDPTVTTSVTDSKLEMDEEIAVKLSRRLGPVSQTRDAFVKQGSDPDVFSSWLGEQFGPDVQIDYLDAAVRALLACLTKDTATFQFDASSGTIETTDLIDVRALMGDRFQRIQAWLMHSKVFHDLHKEQATTYKELGNFTIVQGTNLTLGLPVVITDASPLVISGTPDTYHTFGLTSGAVAVLESEGREVVSDLITGEENLRVRIQGEYAQTVAVKGFKYDSATGGANPNAAALANSANWVQVANDMKSGPGVDLLTQ